MDQITRELFAALNDPDPEVRIAAARQLAIHSERLSPEDVLGVIRRLGAARLSSGNADHPEVRRAVVEALGAIRPLEAARPPRDEPTNPVRTQDRFPLRRRIISNMLAMPLEARITILLAMIAILLAIPPALVSLEPIVAGVGDLVRLVPPRLWLEIVSFATGVLAGLLTILLGFMAFLYLRLEQRRILRRRREWERRPRPRARPRP